MDETTPSAAGCSLEQPVAFPDAILFRGRAADGANCLAAFDRRSLVLSRPVAGLACKIRLNISQYESIALIMGEDSHLVRLTHRQPGLSLDLAMTADFAAAQECRDRLADMLGLPPLLLAGAPAAREPAAGHNPAPRRHRPAKGRRPRFLARRRPGTPGSVRRIEGSELIARR